MILLYIILSYLFSTFMAWVYIHKSCSKGGIYENCSEEPNYSDVCLVLIPVVNTLFFLFGWTFMYPIKRKRKFTPDKFFKIKK